MRKVQQILFEPKLILLFLLMILVESNLFAATYYSRKTGNFNANKVWATSRNGTAGSYPGSGNTYIIQSGDNVKFNADQTVDQVTVESGGTFTITNNYTLTSPLTINSGGALVLNNRRLTMVGDLSNSGDITATTGRIIMDSYSFDNSGTVTMTTTGRIERTSGSITNSGSISMATGRFTAETGTFTNTNTGTFTITDAATVILGTGDFINNNTSEVTENAYEVARERELSKIGIKYKEYYDYILSKEKN